MAAQAGVRYSLENPQSYIDSNVTGFLNVLESMKSHHVEKIVYASSSSVYGGNKNSPNIESDEVNNPLSIYATTKRMNELMAYNYHSLYGFKCLGLRFFTVYGEFDRPDMALFNFTKNIVENETIKLFNNGKMKRSFTHVEDVVNGIISALNTDLDYEVFNIGNGSSIELLEFVKIIENSLHMKAQIEYLPLQQGDALNTFADINKSKELLNFIPKIDLTDGVNRFVEWYKEYYKCV